MPYSINYTVQGKTPLIISDRTINTDTSISLPGRGKKDFGESVHETLIRLLENFASPDAFEIYDVNVSGNYIDVDIEARQAFNPSETYTIFNSTGNNGNYLINSVTEVAGSPTTIRITFDGSTPLSSSTPDGYFGNYREPLQNLVTENYITGQIWYNSREGIFYFYTGSGWDTIVNDSSFTAAVEEAVEDIVGSMIGQMFDSESNTENGIQVTYNENDGPGQGLGKLNFDVNDFTLTLDGAVTGSATITNLSNTTLTTSINHNHDSLYVNVTGDTMTGSLDMSGNRMQNVGDPTIGTDAMSRNYADNRYVNVTGDTMTGSLDMSNNQISNVGNPASADQALNRGYADNRYVNITGDTITGDIDINGSNLTVSGAGQVVVGNPNGGFIGNGTINALSIFNNGQQVLDVSSSIQDLDDVDTAAPSNGNTLIYNNVSGLWEPQTPTQTRYYQQYPILIASNSSFPTNSWSTFSLPGASLSGTNGLVLLNVRVETPFVSTRYQTVEIYIRPSGTGYSMSPYSLFAANRNEGDFEEFDPVNVVIGHRAFTEFNTNNDSIEVAVVVTNISSVSSTTVNLQIRAMGFI